jgi:predicted metalloprotease with PDZ domain
MVSPARPTETEIILPDAWVESAIFGAASASFVSGAGMSALAGADPARKIVRHAPNATLTVRYRITQFWAGEPVTNGENEYRPVIQPTYFHLIGHTTFARPAWNLAEPVSVALRDFPSSWRFASDLEHQSEGKPLRLAELWRASALGATSACSPPVGCALRCAGLGRSAIRIC